MAINNIRIATRQSTLALWQAEYIKKLLLELQPSLNVELVKIVTSGDKNQTDSLKEVGGKSLFVKELQQALLDNKADIAIHCIKDMSVHEHPDLTLGAILKRGDPYDIFSSHQCTHIDKLKDGSVVGTASPRRQSLVKHLYPNLEVKLLRGNLDTRFKKLDDGEYDAIILAAAGIKRLGWIDRIQSHLHKEVFVPAIAQGAMGIECLISNNELLDLIAPLHNEKTATCVLAERTVNRKLNGSCFTPLGAYATFISGELDLNAFVGSLDGKTLIRAHHVGTTDQPEKLALQLADDLIQQGALDIIKDNT
jgi:hydroxymethylbilane synthase